MTAPRRSWIAETLFGLGLLAYPRAFRRRFAAEMRDDFRRRRTLALGTLVRNGLAERWAAVVRWSFFPNATPAPLRTFRETRHVLGLAARRRALRPPPGAAGAALHRAGGGRAGAGHRRQQRHLHRGAEHPAEAAALRRAGAAGDGVEPQHQGAEAREPDLAGQLPRSARRERWLRRAPELLLVRHQHPARRRRPARDDRHLVCRAGALRPARPHGAARPHAAARATPPASWC